MKPTLSLYDTDYQLWLEQTIAQLATQDFSFNIFLTFHF